MHFFIFIDLVDPGVVRMLLLLALVLPPYFRPGPAASKTKNRLPSRIRARQNTPLEKFAIQRGTRLRTQRAKPHRV